MYSLKGNTDRVMCIGRKLLYSVLGLLCITGAFAQSPSGRYVWRYTPSGAVSGNAVEVDNTGRIAVHADDRAVHILRRDGSPDRSLPVGVRPGGFLLYTGRNQLLSGTYDGGVARFSLDYGLQWHVSGQSILPAATRQIAVAPAGNGYTVAAYADGTLIGITPRGQVGWRTVLPAKPGSSGAVWRQGLILGTVDGEVYYVSWQGNVKLLRTFAGAIVAVSAYDQEYAAIAVQLPGNRTGLALVNADGHIAYSDEVNGSIISLSGFLYFGESPALFVHTSSQIAIWQPVLNALVSRAIVVPFAEPARDGSVLIAATGGSLGQLDMQTGILWKGDVPDGGAITRISLLPSGRLITHENRWTLHAFRAPGAARQPAEGVPVAVTVPAERRIMLGLLESTGSALPVLQMVADRTLPAMRSGRVEYLSEVLLHIAAPESGFNPKQRIRATELLPGIAGRKEAAELVSILRRERDPTAAAAAISVLGTIGTTSQVITAVADAVFSESRRRQSTHIAAAAVQAFQNMLPYMGEQDRSTVRAALQIITESPYDPEVRHQAARLERLFNPGVLRQKRLR